MTDKEKLNDIKMWHEGDVDLHQFQIDWLIEQAERVQELEEKNKKNYWIASGFKYENLKLEQQNKRYREAKMEIEERWNQEHEDNPNEYQGGRLDGLDVAIGIIEEALEDSK